MFVSSRFPNSSGFNPRTSDHPAYRLTVRAMGKGDKKEKKEKKKRETPAEKKTREKEEKEEKLAREKEARDAMAAERRGANAREAQAAGPKTRKPPAKPASASEDDDDDDDDHDGEQEPNDAGEEDDDEECVDLAVGDPACKVSQCGLGSASAKWNCARHQKAAREQAANVDTDATRARRERKEGNGGESTSTWGPAPKKKKKHAKDRPVFDVKAAEQAVANAMAPFMQQFHALAAQQVSPVLTGYIRLDRLHLWQVTGGRAAAGAVASTSTGRARPRIESRTIEASLAAAEEAAKRIESKRKQSANKAQKLWRNALVIQFAKLHRCSNLALKMYDRHVRTTTVVKRSIHLNLAPHGITMSRVRLRACWLRLYPFIRFVRIRSRV